MSFTTQPTLSSTEIVSNPSEKLRFVGWGKLGGYGRGEGGVWDGDRKEKDTIVIEAQTPRALGGPEIERLIR